MPILNARNQLMKQLNLISVDQYDSLSKQDFVEDYLKVGKPVVMRNFAKNWPALQKWDYNYLKQGCGQVEVPLYAEAFANSGNDYLASDNKMRFADFLDLIAQGPTQWRMFLFNILQEMPELCHDFDYPDLGVLWLKKFPFVFFGGQDSYVDIHYDLDHSHVFLTQFYGEKKCILFGPECSTKLYRHPFTVSCNIDFRQPDFKKYPQIQNIQGYECTLKHGDTLFMPSKWWHFIDYQTDGFSLALRAMPKGVFRKAAGVWSVAKLKLLDNNIAKMIGHEKWYKIKESWAQRKAIKHRTSDQV